MPETYSSIGEAIGAAMAANIALTRRLWPEGRDRQPDDESTIREAAVDDVDDQLNS
jgi:hypothetical protein